MRHLIKSSIACFLCSSLLGVLVPLAQAQEPKLDDLAKQLGKEISKAKFKSVVVIDFTSLEGNASPAGKLFADRLLEYWLSHHENFSIVERSKLDALLSGQKLARKDLDNSDTLQKLGESLGFDAIVIGTVTPTSEGCSLNVVVRRAQDSKLQSTASKSFSNVELPRYARGEPPDEPASHPLRAGVNGVGHPTCVYCPNPDYTDGLRRQKIQGSAFLSVVVTQDGRVASAKVLKASNDEFGRLALEAVRTWKLKPAMGPDGRPVAVIVPVEVVFRLR